MGAFLQFFLYARKQKLSDLLKLSCVNAFDLFDLLIEIDVLWASREPQLGMIRLRCVEKIWSPLTICLLAILVRRFFTYMKNINNEKPITQVCINNVETVDVFVAIITLKSDVYV